MEADLLLIEQLLGIETSEFSCVVFGVRASESPQRFNGKFCGQL